MNIAAAAMLLVAVQGCSPEQPETINNVIKMKELDEPRATNVSDIDMNYVKSGLTEDGKRIADEMVVILKSLPTQFLSDMKSGRVVFPNQERASFLPKLLDEIIKSRAKWAANPQQT